MWPQQLGVAWARNSTSFVGVCCHGLSGVSCHIVCAFIIRLKLKKSVIKMLKMAGLIKLKNMFYWAFLHLAEGLVFALCW